MNAEQKQLLSEIEELQNIQKTHPVTSSAWQVASELLAPKFERMAELQKGGAK